jgi:HEAT repeat protein
MLSLNPEVHAGLYGYRAAHENSPQDRIDELVAEFKDEEIIRLICSVYEGGLTSPEILARVALRVLPDMGRRTAVAQKLGPELTKRGMIRETWEILKDDILWDVYDLTQKVERLVSRPELTEEDVERIKQIAPPLADERQAKQVQRLLKSLLKAVRFSDTNVRTMVARYMADFHGIVETSGQFKAVGLFFCKKLVTRLMKEPEESVRDALLVSLGAILKEEILKDHLDTGARTVLTLSKSGYLLRLIELSVTLVSQDVTERVITALGDDDQKRRNEASILLKLLGRAVLESVLFVLEREENPDTRRQLMVIVKSMGSEIAAEIVQRLTDKRWYVVRSALYVLGEIADDTFSPDLLTSSVYHDDVRVRKEAIKTLGKLKARGAVKMLCELLEEKDEDIRVFVLRSLGEARDKMAVPHILLLLQKKRLKGPKSELIRQTAIETLGRIGDPEAIPVLLDLLKRKGLFKKTNEAIRKSAVEALGAFKEPELESVLQSVLEKDADANVREAARRALLSLRSTGVEAALQMGA